MNPEDYKPNSNKAKTAEINSEPVPEKRAEKVVTGKVITRKKSIGHKLMDIFAPGDIENVRTYIITDVIVPTIKRSILDIIQNGAQMIFDPDRSLGGGAKSGTRASKVSYQNYYKDDRRDSRYERERDRRSTCDYDDIIFESRGAAESIIDAMDDMIQRYKVVRVADYFELAGVTGDYTGQNYGWTDVRSARVIHVRDGYMIKMPRAIPLD